MNEFYQLEPEVAGEVGPNSVIDRHEHPPTVKYLEYIFSGWLGDCIVESFPVFLITEMAGQDLMGNNLTGYNIRDASITISPTFRDLYPESDTPDFNWLEISGKPFSDDFGLRENMLVVSAEALAVLQKHGLKYCDILKFRKKTQD